MRSRVLYVSYNGLTDDIGQAQVLPYLLHSARAGHRITAITFEKAERRERLGKATAATLEGAGIDWRPQRFNTRPPLLAKLKDERALRAAALAVAAEGGFDLVHCRSYIAARAGLSVKKRFGTPLLFDMRGLWVDQRREGGRWRAGHPLFDLLYRRWKGIEAELIAASDHIISLTDACAKEIRRWPRYRGAPISVCPCGVDFDSFAPPADRSPLTVRAELGIAQDAPVLIYLGSLGSVYRLREMFGFFALLRERHPEAVFLFIGHHPVAELAGQAAAFGLAIPAASLRSIACDRVDVPAYLTAADAGICFITPTYSSLGVSPTKLGEYLACGLPSFCNEGVGDVAQMLQQTGGGYALTSFAPDEMARAVDMFPALAALNRERIRDAARPLLDLETVASVYDDVYVRMAADQ